MSDNFAIEINNIYKSFRVEVRDTLRKGNLLNKHPLKKANKLIIENLSLRVKKGEILGVIGRNGSGKSTLLSIISKIMEPDSGSIIYNGKVASILELGMGFHSDMSGRENIYLKGEMYGFSKMNIDEKIEDIIEYSGIGEYIDAPVRTYSSGMNGRLAFAIMVHVNADIILVDEVLSVGDNVFSIKAREHFKQLSQNNKTAILVSHNLQDIESMCTRVIWIDKGRIVYDGAPNEVISHYSLAIDNDPEIIADLAKCGNPEAQYKFAELLTQNYDQNKQEIINLYKKSADQGYVKSQICYADYLASIGDLENALEYYRYASIKGDISARLKIAILGSHDLSIVNMIKDTILLKSSYYESSELEYASLLLKIAHNNDDFVRAYNIFIKHSNDNEPEAMYQAALLLRDGKGVKKDLKLMEKLLRNASELGHFASINLLADCYYYGRYLPKDIKKSVYFIEKSINFGNFNNISRLITIKEQYPELIADSLGHLYDRFLSSQLFVYSISAGDFIQKNDINDPRIVALYEFAAQNMTYLPVHLMGEYNKLIGKSKNNIEVIKKQSNDNNLKSIVSLAQYYSEGIGVQKDLSIAAELYERAARLGDLNAKAKIAEIYSLGKGVDRDIQKAVYWYKSASDQGGVGSTASLYTLCVSGVFPDEELKKYAFRNMEMLSNSGNITAIMKLAQYYSEGIGVQKDLSIAAELYERAARLGDLNAKNRVVGGVI